MRRVIVESPYAPQTAAVPCPGPAGKCTCHTTDVRDVDHEYCAECVEYMRVTRTRYEEKKTNARYLDAALLDCLRRGEAPFASHGLYTRPGVLDDLKPQERDLGIRAGFEWRRVADATVFYIDLGMSEGMKRGEAHARKLHDSHGIEYRKIPGWK